MTSRWNYGLALASAPMIALDLVLGLYTMALIWAVAAAMHLYVGHVKDKEK